MDWQNDPFSQLSYYTQIDIECQIDWALVSEASSGCRLVRTISGTNVLVYIFATTGSVLQRPVPGFLDEGEQIEALIEALIYSCDNFRDWMTS